jgi:hypothetical protein
VGLAFFHRSDKRRQRENVAKVNNSAKEVYIGLNFVMPATVKRSGTKSGDLGSLGALFQQDPRTALRLSGMTPCFHFIAELA